MPTWNPNDFSAAISKAGSEKLTDHERRKLDEARRQHGGRGVEALKALEKDQKRFGR